METILKSNSQDTQVSVLMINDKGIMLSVKVMIILYLIIGYLG